jgi:hypothetical protein
MFCAVAKNFACLAVLRFFMDLFEAALFLAGSISPECFTSFGSKARGAQSDTLWLVSSRL